jgi:phosphinothricin acetyltransferase
VTVSRQPVIALSKHIMFADTLEIRIRPSNDADVDPMLSIYRHHIRRGVDPAYQGGAEAFRPDDLKRRRRSKR